MNRALEDDAALQLLAAREDMAHVAIDLAREAGAAQAVLSLDAGRFGVGSVGTPGLPPDLAQALAASADPGPLPSDGVIVRDFEGSARHAGVAAQLRAAGIAMSLLVPLKGRTGVVGAAELLFDTTEEPDAIHRLRVQMLAEQVAMNIVTTRLFGLVERAKREWEVTFDAIRDGIMVLDRDCRIRRANWGMGIMLGTTPSTLVGQTCHEAVFARPSPCAQCPLVPHGSARPFKARECEDTIDGKTVHQSMYPLIAEDGSLSGVVSIIRDVTERKQKEEEFLVMHEKLVLAHGTLQGSMDQLKAAQAQLIQSEKMGAVGQLISGVAHELNNPLTGIIGYSQLISDGGEAAALSPEKLTKYMRMMGREAVRCHKIVQNLLTFARRNEVEKRLTDLNEVVRRTTELKGYELKVTDIAIELELAPSLPLTLADQYQLQQVLLNLLHNSSQAIKAHTGRGTIRVRTRLAESERPPVSGQVDPPAWLLLEVEDDGPGFTDDVAQRMFDPFFTTKGVGEGTGLGLSICYGIVAEHLGHIGAERGPDGGAIFRVELPVLRSMGDRKKAPSEGAAAALPPETPLPVGRRVLVVDDEATICDMVRDILVLEGHVVDTARNGRAGLELLQRQSYDCVLADLKMPEVDGPTLYRTLHDRDPAAAARIIFMTGDMLSEGSREFLESTGNAYLAKPFSLRDLRARIAAVVAVER